ncbi:MAG: PAS domain S-box protein [Pyrinomonadaceae bacterium]
MTKTADADLICSDNLFRNAFDHAAIGMAIVGLDGSWLDANGAICDILGYDKNELLTTTFQAITHPDDVEADLALVQQVIAGEIPTYHMEKRYIHKFGYIVWALLSVSALVDGEGRPLYFISQIQDITARKQAEMQLRETNKELLLALNQVQTLQELLPICSYCKHVRDDQNYWQSVEKYITQHTGTQFSHGICPNCYDLHIKPELDVIREQNLPDYQA